MKLLDKVGLLDYSFDLYKRLPNSFYRSSFSDKAFIYWRAWYITLTKMLSCRIKTKPCGWQGLVTKRAVNNKILPHVSPHPVHISTEKLILNGWTGNISSLSSSISLTHDRLDCLIWQEPYQVPLFWHDLCQQLHWVYFLPMLILIHSLSKQWTLWKK